MMLNGSKLKETQVHLLLSSRAEMQKVIETARQQTISFMNFSAQQPSVPATPSLPVAIAPQITIPGIQAQQSVLNGSNSVVGLLDQQLTTAKPQPPIITSSSLSGILAQQMLQQHQIQLIRQQQNMPVLTSTSVRHDTYKSMSNPYNAMNHPYGDNSVDANGKSIQGNDSSRQRGERSRNSRSRSRSRDRRDRKRSRSRERSRRYRDRSRSRERRRRSRRSHSSDRRSRSHGRERSSRDDARKDRSYDKDVRLSLDRNKNVDENKTNFNSSMENNFNSQPGQPKSLNYSDSAGTSINNFNNEPNDGPFNNFNNYPSKVMNEFEPTMAMVAYKESDNNFPNIGSCIRITNMNNRTHYAAIRKFFYGLQIPNDGIKLLNDEDGKRRNDVVIRFARPDIARDALALDGKILNGNLVRVTAIDDAEYENEIDSFQPPRRNTGRFGNRYDDRSYGGDHRGGSQENNSRESNYRRNNRDHHDRGYQRGRYNDDSGNQSNDSRDRNGDDDVMLITDSNDGEAVPVGLTLLIEDLPPFAKEQDIIKMFSEFTLMDIMLEKVNKVFRAYAKFHSQNDAEAALKQTHLHRIDFKSVYVSPCSEEAYEKAKQEYDGIGDTINKPEVKLSENVQVKSISNSNEISRFQFHPTDESKNSGRDDPSHNYNDSDDFRNNSSRGDNEVDQFGRSLNIRNRKFVNQQEQQPSVPDNKPQIPSLFNVTFDPPFIANQQNDSKFVPADPRLRRQFDQNNSQSPDSQLSPNQQQSKAFNPFNQQGRIDPRLQRNSALPLPNLTNSTNTKVIFIGNVEYNTSESDIVSFFADIGTTPDGVFFVKNARGQPCGDCYVKFKSADDATKALIKNRFRFRSRVIRVTLAEPDDAAKVLGFSLTDSDNETANLNDSGANESIKNDATEKSVPETNDKNDKEMDMDDGGQNADRNFDNNDEQADDDDNADDNNSGKQYQREDPRMMYNNAPYHSRGGNIGDRSSNGNMMNTSNNNFRGGRGGGSDSRGMRGNYNQNNAQRNYDGCIVSLNNVPFAATPRDIADLFSEYNLGPNDIIRRFNDDGSLTGEARVRFLTPLDASEAIERHQRERIRNRVIHLRLVT